LAPSAPPAFGRSTVGCSNTNETRSGFIGVPRALAWAEVQLATKGTPPVPACIGPLMSAISNVGWKTCAATTRSVSTSVSGGCSRRSSTTGSTQRTSIRNGKPPMVCCEQV
jgi:hypothetical protein